MSENVICFVTISHAELKRKLKNNFLQKLVFHAKKLWLEVIFASSEKEYSVKINYKNLSHWYLVNTPMCFYETVYLALFILSNIRRESTSNFLLLLNEKLHLWLKLMWK